MESDSKKIRLFSEMELAMIQNKIPTDAFPVDDVILHMVDFDNLQTRILTTMVSEHFSLPCHILGLASADQFQYCATHQYFSLINCLAYSVDDINNLLVKLYKTNQGHRIALINISRDSEFEELISWPQVMGMFYADSKPEQLLQGLQEVMDNGHWLPRHLTLRILNTLRQAPIQPKHQKVLTPREMQILEHLIDGQTNQEIGEHFYVSSHTVRSHLYNVFKKIGVKNRTQACNWAIQNL